MRAGIYGGEDAGEAGWGAEGAGGEDEADDGGELFVAEGGGVAGLGAEGFGWGGAGVGVFLEGKANSAEARGGAGGAEAGEAWFFGLVTALGED